MCLLNPMKRMIVLLSLQRQAVLAGFLWGLEQVPTWLCNPYLAVCTLLQGDSAPTAPSIASICNFFHFNPTHLCFSPVAGGI